MLILHIKYKFINQFGHFVKDYKTEKSSKNQQNITFSNTYDNLYVFF